MLSTVLPARNVKLTLILQQLLWRRGEDEIFNEYCYVRTNKTKYVLIL